VALGCLGNAIWFVFGGVWLALGHLIAGILLCVTVIWYDPHSSLARVCRQDLLPPQRPAWRR
jgi:uncharacterized membrane protein YccF (DUF307 family)